MKLITTYDGKELLHRRLWQIVEEQAQIAQERERGWSRNTLVALVFAFHTIEAYLNYVGEKLAPEIWEDERNFFHKEPYRGWEGKFRKVLELVDLPWKPNDPPLRPILELKKLRDLIAHGRSERMQGQIIHDVHAEMPFPTPTIQSGVIPKDKLSVLPEVENFLDQVQRLAKPKIGEDIWFCDKALRGPAQYSASHSELILES